MQDPSAGSRTPATKSKTVSTPGSSGSKKASPSATEGAAATPPSAESRAVSVMKYYGLRLAVVAVLPVHPLPVVQRNLQFNIKYLLQKLLVSSLFVCILLFLHDRPC